MQGKDEANIYGISVMGQVLSQTCSRVSEAPRAYVASRCILLGLYSTLNLN